MAKLQAEFITTAKLSQQDNSFRLRDLPFFRDRGVASITNGHYGESHLRSLFGLGDPDEATARVLGTIAG